MYQLKRSKRDVQRIFDNTSFIEPSIKKPEETESDEYMKENIYRDFFISNEKSKEQTGEETGEETGEQTIEEEILEKRREKELLEKELSEMKSEKDRLEDILETERQRLLEISAQEEIPEEEPIGEGEGEAEPEPEPEDEFNPPEEEEEQPDEQQQSEEPEDIMEDLPITTYDYGDESYYIDNTPFLERTFLFPDGIHPIDLCIYTCVRNGCMPYVLYLTIYDKSKNTLVFPSAESITISEKDSDDDIRSQTMENFQTSLFNIFPPNETKEEPSEQTDVYYPQLFKGTFTTSDKITMVYDATRVQVPISTDKEYFWITPYEILVLYQCKNLIIDDSVISFFQTVATSSGFIDKSFYQLKRVSDGSLVPTPYVLFPCSPSSSTPFLTYIMGDTSIIYENTTQLEEEQIDIFIPTIDHPKFGKFPMFSSLPLDKSKPHIQRFAVFVDIDDLQPTFLDKEKPDLIDHLYDIQEKRQFSSISFIEKDIQYWCVKSPLYFSEIYNDRRSFIPITSFNEIAADELVHEPIEAEVEEAATEEEEEDDGSNDGSEESNEGSEESNEDSDSDSDSSSDAESNEESDESESSSDESESESDEESDEYKRGYEEGLRHYLSGLKKME